MLLKYTLEGTLDVPDGSTLDGSIVTLPDGTQVTLDLTAARSQDGLLSPLSDADADALGCTVRVDDIQATEAD